MDRYDDNPYEDFPDWTSSHQDIIITLEWAEDATENRINSIIQDIENNVYNDIDEIFNKYFWDACERFEIKGNFIFLTYWVEVPIQEWLPGERGDRWSPGYPPQPLLGAGEYEDEIDNAKGRLRQKVKDLFEKKGYTEIKDVLCVELGEVNYDEAFNNA